MVRVNYGDRARIGLIYMHSSIVMEPEFVAMAPEGVTVHTTRIVLPKVTAEGLDQLARSPELERCTELLAAAPLNVIAFGGTSASFLHGIGWDRQMIERMTPFAGGIPVTTTSTASLSALRTLGVRRIAIATPYIDEVNERCIRFFRENGFDVLRLKGLGIDSDHGIGNVTSEQVYQLGLEADHPEAEALFISCTNLRTAEVIAALEAKLNKPVVSAIQATFWQCLRLAGVPDDRPQFGRLFSYAAEAA